MEQVDEEIQVGRIVNRAGHNDARQARLPFDLALPRKGAAVGTEPYTAGERLRLLIDAAESTFDENAEFEEAVVEFFTGVVIASDLETRALRPEEIMRRRAISDRLHGLFQELVIRVDQT